MHQDRHWLARQEGHVRRGHIRGMQAESLVVGPDSTKWQKIEELKCAGASAIEQVINLDALQAQADLSSLINAHETVIDLAEAQAATPDYSLEPQTAWLGSAATRLQTGLQY